MFEALIQRHRHTRRHRFNEDTSEISYDCETPTGQNAAIHLIFLYAFNFVQVQMKFPLKFRQNLQQLSQTKAGMHVSAVRSLE